MSGVALVTGAARGIGLAVAERLLAAGFSVARLDRDCDDARAADTAAGGRTAGYRCDIADLTSHAALLERIAAELGEPTCLVNNAGVTSLTRGDMLDLSPESFDHVLGINLRGTFFLSQAFARRRIRAGQANASIVFIGSVNADIVGENRADYCISKSGVWMMSKLFAARLAPAGIAVFEIRPGIIRTAMTAPAAARYDGFIAEGGVPLGRWGEPADIAETVLALVNGAIPYATGIHVDVAGGMQLHRV